MPLKEIFFHLYVLHDQHQPNELSLNFKQNLLHLFLKKNLCMVNLYNCKSNLCMVCQGIKFHQPEYYFKDHVCQKNHIGILEKQYNNQDYFSNKYKQKYMGSNNYQN